MLGGLNERYHHQKGLCNIELVKSLTPLPLNLPLLIFDEATSALDSLTEEQITATIKNISADNQQMTILIAHRLSTIMHADPIYVLERGQIVEQGNHVELLAKKGLYFAMWRQQIGERHEPVVNF